MEYVSEKIWWSTNLPERDDGKKTLKKLIDIEHLAGHLPDWAVAIIENNINYFPPCGHEMLQHNVNAILKALEEEHKVENFFFCFTMSDDALSKAQQVVKKCSKITPPTSYAAVLANRLRWWLVVDSKIKGNPFTPDNGERRDYYEWDEKTKNTISSAGLSPDNELVKKIKNTWLCAPKAFRFIEKIGTEINVNLGGFDTYNKDSFRTVIVDSMKRIESAILNTEENGNFVAKLILVLLRAKLTEYIQNGMLKKVLRT